MIQAWLDASANSYNAFSLSGYVASVEGWGAFSNEWQSVLDMNTGLHEPIKVFRMSAMDLQYQPHMERCELLYRVIEKFTDASISIVMPRGDLKEVLGRFKNPNRVRKIKELRNPYFWGFYGLLEIYLNSPNREMLLKEGDLFLDSQSEEDRINAAWKQLKAINPRSSELPFDRPIFQDDKKFKPLQAADMLAFWCRKWESEGQFMEKLKAMALPWPSIRKIPRYYLRFDKEKIQKILDAL